MRQENEKRGKDLPNMALGDTDVGVGIALVLCTPLVLGSRVHHQPVGVVKAVSPTWLPLCPLLPERECRKVLTVSNPLPLALLENFSSDPVLFMLAAQPC